jgi:hypothetical protein
MREKPETRIELKDKNIKEVQKIIRKRLPGFDLNFLIGLENSAQKK